ncbi:hypothetical protein Taro_011960 [Colocasia esculenta]|uniref:Uncharacterized protein n=1 Tax=Colocasia esculenta TaxID=4460 RepID=A0A843U7S1_COLES|nr:hypothetical protein [Colocasia esculenta]
MSNSNVTSADSAFGVGCLGTMQVLIASGSPTTIQVAAAFPDAIHRGEGGDFKQRSPADSRFDVVCFLVILVSVSREFSIAAIVVSLLSFALHSAVTSFSLLGEAPQFFLPPDPTWSFPFSSFGPYVPRADSPSPAGRWKEEGEPTPHIPRFLRVLSCSCVPWLADGHLEGSCVPRSCWACHGLQASGSAWFLLWLPRLFARCLALEGLSRSEVVSVAWDPRPRETVEGVIWATSVLELAADLADSRAEGKTRKLRLLRCFLPDVAQISHVVVLGVGPQLGQAAVLRAFLWCSVAALSRSSVEAEARARLASRGHGQRVPLLAASGGGLVVVVVTAFLHDFRSPVLGCQFVVALACVASRPRGVSGVRGGPICGPSTLWRSEVVVLVFSVFGVPATLAGEGLVIPTGPCSRDSLPLLPSTRGSSSWELGVGRVTETAVAPCVVSSSKRECCELLYLSELRVVLCKFSGTYLTRLFLLTLPGLRIRGWRRELRGPWQGSGRSVRYNMTDRRRLEYHSKASPINDVLSYGYLNNHTH